MTPDLCSLPSKIPQAETSLERQKQIPAWGTLLETVRVIQSKPSLRNCHQGKVRKPDFLSLSPCPFCLPRSHPGYHVTSSCPVLGGFSWLGQFLGLFFSDDLDSHEECWSGLCRPLLTDLSDVLLMIRLGLQCLRRTTIEAKHPSCHTSRYTPSTWFTTADGDPEHRVESHLSGSPLESNSLLPFPLDTFWKEVTVHSPQWRMGDYILPLWRQSGYINSECFAQICLCSST